jgi:branched-chain amino acid transport system ATP-binding protein
MALLEISDLVVGYHGVPVLFDLSFSIDEGETAVLLGLNGAGKTTTVSAVAGLLAPMMGSIRFDGAEIGGLAPDHLVRRGISLVPEGRRVFPRLSIAQNLRMGAWTTRRDKSRVAALLDQILGYFPRLGERANQLAGTLSGGEQQQLSIARALMSRPRLLLVDEASLGLSPLLATTVFQIIDRINDDGVTVLAVEQNIGVLKYADRALVLEKGRLVYQGVGEEIRQARLREMYFGIPTGSPGSP